MCSCYVRKYMWYGMYSFYTQYCFFWSRFFFRLISMTNYIIATHIIYGKMFDEMIKFIFMISDTNFFFSTFITIAIYL